MYADNNDRPGLDEQYIVATNTSDLTLNPDRVDSATHLIAAGLLGNRMGQALVFLRAEWDAAEKPRKATEDEILARAGDLPKRKGKVDVKRARTELLVGYSVAMRHRAHKLVGWLPALGIMAEWAALRRVDMDLISPALYHWLAPTCPVCDGLGHRKMDDAPVLGKECHHCNGSGKWPKPLGADRVHDWLGKCVGKAKSERSGLLHGRIDSDDLKERTANRLAPLAEDERGAAAVAEVARNSMGRVRPKG
jgi:hypothetical protein